MSTCLVSSCDENVIVTEDICGQGIEPGGQVDLDFLNTIVLLYYLSYKWLFKTFSNKLVLSLHLSKKWLTNTLPRGQKYLEKDKDKILSKCHKNTYNYCDKGDLVKFGNCVKSLAGGLLVSVMD